MLGAMLPNISTAVDNLKAHTPPYSTIPRTTRNLGNRSHVRDVTTSGLSFLPPSASWLLILLPVHRSRSVRDQHGLPALVDAVLGHRADQVLQQAPLVVCRHDDKRRIQFLCLAFWQTLSHTRGHLLGIADQMASVLTTLRSKMHQQLLSRRTL